MPTAIPAFGLNLQGVDATRQYERDLERARSQEFQSPISRSFYQLGSIFGHIADQGKDSAAVVKARGNELVQSQYGKDVDAGLDAPDADPVGVQIEALRSAATNLRALGSPDEASSLDSQVVQLRIQKQMRDLEVSKLKAETANSESGTVKNYVEAGNVGKGTPGEHERLVRLLQDDNTLNAESKSLVRNFLIKAGTVTGTTPNDPGATKPTNATLTDMQKDIKDNQPALDLLRNTVSNYKSELDLGDYGNKGLYETLKVASGFRAASPQQQAWMAAAASQQQRIQESYNTTVKLLSGSAVSAPEQLRVDKQLIVESDPPAIKQAKMQAALAYQEAAQARRMAAAAGGGDVNVTGTPVESYMTREQLRAWNYSSGDGGKAGGGSPAGNSGMSLRERAEAAMAK